MEKKKTTFTQIKRVIVHFEKPNQLLMRVPKQRKETVSKMMRVEVGRMLIECFGPVRVPCSWKVLQSEGNEVKG